jgi:hypothetical protein
VRQLVELARLVVGEALGSTLGRIREEGTPPGPSRALEGWLNTLRGVEFTA